MNFSHKLFDVVDDEPVVNPVIINLGPFKKLYQEDKSTDKTTYVKQLQYMWYANDPISPLYNAEDKEKEAMALSFGKEVKFTKTMLDCIEEYKKRQSTPETRTLEKTIKLCDSMINDLDKSKQGINEFNRLVDDIDNLLKRTGSTEDDIEKRIELISKKMTMEKQVLDNAKTISDLIPKISKQLESIIEMRKKVEKSIIELDSETNKDAISNFVIDNFINKNS
jgi:hypothetical protein